MIVFYISSHRNHNIVNRRKDQKHPGMKERIQKMKCIYTLILFSFNIHKHYIYIYIYIAFNTKRAFFFDLKK